MAEHGSWTPDETGMDEDAGDTPCPHCGDEACERACTGAILADEAGEDAP